MRVVAGRRQPRLQYRCRLCTGRRRKHVDLRRMPVATRPGHEQPIELLRPQADARPVPSNQPREAVQLAGRRVEDIDIPLATDDVHAAALGIVEKVVCRLLSWPLGGNGAADGVRGVSRGCESLARGGPAGAAANAGFATAGGHHAAKSCIGPLRETPGLLDSSRSATGVSAQAGLSAAEGRSAPGSHRRRGPSEGPLPMAEGQPTK
jgi:hypothetical protein